MMKKTKYTVIFLIVFSITACSAIRKTPEPCVCGPLKEINQRRIQEIS